MRAIDADKIKQRLQEHHDFYTNAYGGYKNLPVKEKARVDEITSCIADVVNAPTLDVVPVIRCRECKHKSQGISDKMRTWCSMWQCWILQGDGYCHMAAEMDAGQEDDENA